MLIAIIAVLIAAGGAGAALAIVASDKSSHTSPSVLHGAHSKTVIVENASGAGTSAGTGASAAAAGGATTATENGSQASASPGVTTGVKGAATSATPSGQGPDMIIREHLEDLQNGDYQGAFELMTTRYRGENPSWASTRQTADPTIHIVSIGSADYRSGAAHVYVDFYAQDAHPTPGSDTNCREFRGTVELISEEGVWRYNPYGDTLKSKLQPNSDCQS